MRNQTVDPYSIGYCHCPKYVDNVSYYASMGRVLTVEDDNFMAVVGNLKKAQNSWSDLTRILVWEGAKTFFTLVVLCLKIKSIGIFKKIGQQMYNLYR